MRALLSRRGSASLEFGLVAVPLFSLILGICEVGYDQYAQVALDMALRQAARQVQIGNAQGIASAGAFAQRFVCPALGELLPCGQVVVNVRPVSPDFLNGASDILDGAAFCPGAPGQLMLAQASYQGPSFLGALVPGFATGSGGAFVHVTLSSVGFVNEAFQQGAPLPAGCA
jgi:hypothetical protein